MREGQVIGEMQENLARNESYTTTLAIILLRKNPGLPTKQGGIDLLCRKGKLVGH